MDNIPEEMTTDNTEDTLIAQNTDIGIEKGKIPNSFMRQKDQFAT